jgi:Ca-activated chloride channel homolog
MKKLSLILLIMLGLYASSNAQRIISGLVTDAETNEPLIGAAIILKGTTIGTLTDVDGKYSIAIKPKVNTLIVSFTGYESKEINIGLSDTINIQLNGSSLLNEVVVVGYGTVKNNAQIRLKGKLSNKIYGSKAPTSGAMLIENIKEKRFRKDKELNNEEKYAHYTENDFETPAKSPLSTFSIDVDKASYSNLRRYIKNGDSPPEDAVRIEEMINYFDYNLPEPNGQHPLSISTELGTCPWAKTHSLLKVDLQAQRKSFKQMPPNNFVFLIDVSGSMQSPDKLGLLKEAMNLLVKQLRSDDYVSIVTYAGNAGLVLDATSRSDKDKIIKAINGLEAGGSTAGGEGIQLAYEIAEGNFITNGIIG